MERFGSSNQGDLLNLLREKNAPNTDNSTANSWNIFTCYLQAKSLNIDVETISKVDLKEIVKT